MTVYHPRGVDGHPIFFALFGTHIVQPFNFLYLQRNQNIEAMTLLIISEIFDFFADIFNLIVELYRISPIYGVGFVVIIILGFFWNRFLKRFVDQDYTNPFEDLR